MLDDHIAVQRVLHQYGEALDYGLRDQFAACFTEDAVYDIRVPSEALAGYPQRGGELIDHGVRYAGLERILGFFSSHTHAPEAAHKHVVTNEIIDVDGDVARSRSYFQRIDVTPSGTIFTRAYGRYVDELRKEDGRWRIARRVAQADALDLREIRMNTMSSKGSIEVSE